MPRLMKAGVVVGSKTAKGSSNDSRSLWLYAAIAAALAIAIALFFLGTNSGASPGGLQKGSGVSKPTDSDSRGALRNEEGSGKGNTGTKKGKSSTQSSKKSPKSTAVATDATIRLSDLKPFIVMGTFPDPLIGWGNQAYQMACYLPLLGYWPVFIRIGEFKDAEDPKYLWIHPCGARVSRLLNHQRPLVALLNKKIESRQRKGKPMKFPVPVFFSDTRRQWPLFRGKRNMAAVAYETLDLPNDEVNSLRKLDLVIAHSVFNRDLLLKYRDMPRVALLHQGVDPDIFPPKTDSQYQRTNSNPKRFLIFTGGKFEFRKAHDLVAAGVDIFASRHPDTFVQIIGSWMNVWPNLVNTIICSGAFKKSEPPWPAKTDDKHLKQWFKELGILQQPNVGMWFTTSMRVPANISSWHKAIDVAVFPNRAEGGTNMVAMEAMMRGLPVILTNSTGHMDLMNLQDPTLSAPPADLPSAAQDTSAAFQQLLRDEHARLGPLSDEDLTRPYFYEASASTPVKCHVEYMNDPNMEARIMEKVKATQGGFDEGWLETTPERVADALDEVFRDRKEAARRGAQAARLMRRLHTWESRMKPWAVLFDEQFQEQDWDLPKWRKYVQKAKLAESFAAEPKSEPEVETLKRQAMDSSSPF